MAKEAAKKKAGKAKRTPPAIEKPEWGIDQLAKKLGIDTAACRARLRSHGVKKKGRTYDFGSKAGMEKVAKELESKKAA